MGTQPRRPRPWRHAWRATAIVVAVAFCLVFAGDQASATEWDEPTKELKTVLTNARDWLVGIAGAVVVVMLTIAGLRYVLGGGDPGETEKAKTALRAALVGLAIVVLAPVLVGIAETILGG